MTPWRILIADDEPKIRAGLRSQIERMRLNAVVCAEAEDGEVALELAERERPDLVLADINMPFVNGLDFVRALSRTRADTRVIVITGYEKFEYARMAVDLNVQAYLLKPIDLEELRRVLAQAMREMELERSHNRHFEWAIAQIAKRREFLLEGFLRDAIAGRIEEDEIREFGVYFDFPGAELRLLLTSIRNDGMEEKPWTTLLRQYALEEALRLAPPAGMSFSCLFSDDRDNIALLYRVQPDAEAALLATVRHSLEGEPGARVQMESESVKDLAGLPRAYDAALERLMAQTRLSPVVEAAKAYIVAHYADDTLDLTRVSESLSIHPVYLSRLMKQELGMPFARYLTHVRIGRAAQLMQDRSLKVWQIAEMVGYSGPNYFSAAFKKVLGVSPAEYRSEGVQG